jgi:Flp pilus assembly protein TadG
MTHPDRWMRRLRDGDVGQALVEAALTLPLLFLLLLGAAELAWLAYNAIEVANAAKAGVAYGAQSVNTAADATGIQNAARLDASDVTATLTATSSTAGVCSSGAACTGAGNTCLNTDCPSPDHIETILTVNTSATVSPLIHLAGLPLSYTLHGKAVQKCVP